MLATPSLQLWLRGETITAGVTPDSSGKGNNGTVSGVIIEAGKVGSCFKFDGVDDKIELPLNSTCNTYNNGAVAFWMKRNGTSSGGGAYHSVYQRFNSSTQGLQIFIPNATNKFSIYTNNVFTFNYVIDTNWHHFILSMSGTTAALYVDGVLNQTLTSVTYANAAIATFHNIGKYDFGNWLNANIDEFMIFTKFINDSNAKRIYCGLHPLNG